MKRQLATTIAALMISAGAGLAQAADSKNLPTDVLEAQQLEAQLGLDYNRSSADNNGRQALSTASGSATLGAGIGYGIEISATLPYLISRNPGSENGIEDVTVATKYRFNEENAAWPATVTVGLSAKLNSGDSKLRTARSSDISPSVAASRTMGSYTPYAQYRATLRQNGLSDCHQLRLGAQYGVGTALLAAVDVSVSGTFNTGGAATGANESAGAEISGTMVLGRGLFLIPVAGFSVSSDTPLKSGGAVTGQSDYHGAVALRYLF